MRAAALLLLLALALPGARAQEEIAIAIEGAIEPFSLTEQSAQVLVDVDCSLFAGVPPMVRVSLALEGAPEWFVGTFSQPELSASPTECPGARKTLATTLKMFRGPAHVEPIADMPYAVTLRAVVEDARGTTYTAEMTLVVSAALRGSARVEAAPSDGASARPGEPVTLAYGVVNDWNAPILVSWTPDARAASLGLAPPPTRVEANARGSALLTLRVPDDAGPAPLELALGWAARRDPSGEELGNGSVRALILLEMPVAASAPTLTPESPTAPTPGMTLATVAAGAVLALALRRR